MTIVARAGTFVKGNVCGGLYLCDSARLMRWLFRCLKIKQF